MSGKITGSRAWLTSLIIFLCIATISRNLVWKDHLSLWLGVTEHTAHKIRPFLNLSTAYLEKLDLDNSLAALSTATTIFKDEITSGNTFYLGAALEAYLTFAAIYGMKGDINMAMEFLYKAIETNPSSPRANYGLAFAFMEKEDFKSAEPYLKKAISIAEDPKAFFLYADMLDRTGRQAEALPLIKRAVYLEPEDANYRNRLGILFKSLGRKAEAEAEWQLAVRMSPFFTEPYVNLGSMMYEAGKIGEAYKYYRAALEKNPLSYEAWVGKGNALDEMGRGTDAIEAYQKAISVAPTRYEAYLELGISLEKKGKKEDAAAAYKNALNLKPANKEIIKRLSLLAARSE